MAKYSRHFASVLGVSQDGTVRVDQDLPFYNLDTPGMPLPGADFIAAAAACGDPPPEFCGTGKNKFMTDYGPWLEYVYRRALYDEQFQLPIKLSGRVFEAPCIPGHLLGEDTQGWNGGPVPAKVMLIGKHPGQEEVEERVNFVGPTSTTLFDALHELGVDASEYAMWYVTNLVRWPKLDPQKEAIPQEWVKDCLPLLHQELRLVEPDYILCLGSDASKALLGSKYGVQAMTGRVLRYHIPLHEGDEPPRYKRAQVMTVTHPASVYRNTELYGDFLSQMRLFVQLLAGVDIGAPEKGLHYEDVYTARRLREIVEQIRRDPDPMRRFIAVDAEWHGEHPADDGAYLRTVQFSSKHGESFNVVLRHQGGELAFKPGIPAAVDLLNRLLRAAPEEGYFPRVGGWFFRADLQWLVAAGVDIREEYAPPDRLEDCRSKGGWEGSLAYHATFESASYKLEDVAARLTSCPRWDLDMMDWRKWYCAAHGIKEKHLEGYGMAPSWVLHPYAQVDPDATRRIAVRLFEPGGLLDSDWFKRSSWEPYWMAHRASLGFLEMEMTGLSLDRERLDRLTDIYMQVQQRLLQAFRDAIGWPEFNPDSQPQCVALLFGDEYVNKRDKNTGALIRIRPPNATCLGLEPIKTTGKRSKLWPDVVARGEQAFRTPSVDKEVLGILGHQHPIAMQLRDLKFIGQVLKGFLRRPDVNDDGYYAVDEDGYYVLSDGVGSMVRGDGRVHTRLSQVKETGRAGSAAPNLQTVSKRRESDYLRILGVQEGDGSSGDYLELLGGPRYLYPIRTIFQAGEGNALIECDYVGAEVAMLAWMSGDHTMIERVRRNALPDDHPDFFDMHSQTAVRCFQLDCEPTKAGLKSIGKIGLRVAAKNVQFGIPYGRSAGAIARQCREEGVYLTEVQAQELVDFYANDYPQAMQFLAECRERSQDPRWLENCFGRRRRFMRTKERGVIGEQERQAQNAPIQGGVADAVNTAIANFLEYRKEEHSVPFWLALQIHDALLFEVPLPHVEEFAYDVCDSEGRIIKPSVIRRCMVDQVPIWPRRLDGSPMPVEQPYRFGIDAEVAINWGEKIKRSELAKNLVAV